MQRHGEHLKMHDENEGLDRYLFSVTSKVI